MAVNQSGYEQYRKPTHRDEFLATIEAIVPWAALCEVIEPHYPRAGNGRPPIGLDRTLRIHFELPTAAEPINLTSVLVVTGRALGSHD